jgi:hypothetical protein
MGEHLPPVRQLDLEEIVGQRAAYTPFIVYQVRLWTLFAFHERAWLGTEAC